MLAFPLFADISGVEVQSITEQSNSLQIVLKTTSATAVCPLCNTPSGRVHSRYERTVADLPWAGRRAQLHLLVRRFFCSATECQRKVFTERIPEVVAPHGRSTVRLAAAQRCIGLALGGQGGERLAAFLAMPISGDAILRRIREVPLPDLPAPQVVGVDDWALRRGQRYGTLLCDLVRRRPIAMLPDRSAETLSAWLKEHPHVEIVSRDRADEYAKGAAEGAPQATQVADRWHLLKNLQDALHRVIDCHHRQVEKAICDSENLDQTGNCIAVALQPEMPAKPIADVSAKAASLRQVRRERRLKSYEQVIALHDQGLGQRAIARQTGLSRRTVRRYVQADSFPERTTPIRSRGIDQFIGYLALRWNEGCCNAVQLHKELQSQGYTGSYYSVCRRVAAWRAPHSEKQGSRPAAGRLSPRRTAWLLVKSEIDLSEDEAQFVERLEEQCPEIKSAASLAREFSRMVRNREAPLWSDWLTRATAPEVPTVFRRFAEGLRGDEGAVKAALSLPWSNGQLEGQINRLKTLKRQMYGRASFDLLRRRFLAAA